MIKKAHIKDSGHIAIIVPLIALAAIVFIGLAVFYNRQNSSNHGKNVSSASGGLGYSVEELNDNAGIARLLVAETEPNKRQSIIYSDGAMEGMQESISLDKAGIKLSGSGETKVINLNIVVQETDVALGRPNNPRIIIKLNDPLPAGTYNVYANVIRKTPPMTRTTSKLFTTSVIVK